MLSLYEIGTNFLPGLDKVDELFAKLKELKSEDDFGPLLDQLNKECKKIFGVKFFFRIYKHNYFYFGVYAPLKPDSSLEIIKTPKKVNIKNLRFIRLTISSFTLEKMEPRELTAILLHEIGHTINKISDISFATRRVLSILGASSVGILITLFTKFIWLYPAIVMGIMLDRRFNSQEQELRADKFAIEYGYGDELAKGFKKKISRDKQQESERKKQSTLKEIYYYLCSIIEKLLSTHPTMEKRLKETIKEILNKYKNEYPDLEQDLGLN